jgi:NADPH-dependent 2,4-dienoyl-CoA reductase/sulfur reductase-like enzyme
MAFKFYFVQIPGLLDALETPGVGSNYSNQHVDKTWKALQEFKGGNAVFTFPNTPIKCAGAPQKIMYLAEKILRKEGRRDSARIEYHTPLPVLFGVKKYADALWKVVEERDINVSLRSNLVEVKPDKKIAVFQNLDKPEDAPTEVEYSLLHATPPMGPPDVLKNNKKLTDPAGFLDVNKETLRHVSYPNIFGVGDCTNVPCAKTGAAVAGQMGVLRRNLSAALEGKSLEAK